MSDEHEGLSAKWSAAAEIAEATLREEMNERIERSSLGTPSAKRLRESVPVEVGEEIVGRAKERRIAEALELIASRGCVCGGAYCRHLKSLPHKDWCSPCIAADALATPTPSSPESSTPGDAEIAHPGPPCHGDRAAGTGCAPNVS